MAQSASAEPMLDPDWLFTWWTIYGASRRLAVGLFYEGERLVAIAPFCHRVHKYGGVVPFRRLEFMGAGDEPDRVCSEYLNLIVARGFERAVAFSVVKALKDGAFGVWDECALEMMHGDDPMVALLAEAFGGVGLVPEQTELTEAPFIALPRDWDAYLETLDSSKRKRFRQILRKFEAWAGDRGYRLNRAHDQASLDEGWRILQALHGQRWNEQGSAGVFEAERFRNFHRTYLERALERDKVELLWLTVGERPVAAMYNINSGGCLYFYQSGRDVSVPDDLSIGFVMIFLVLQDAMARGLKEFDFLGGDTGYKQRFTAKTRPLVQLRVVRSKLLEAARKGLTATKRGLRKLQGSAAVSRLPTQA